MAEYNKMQSLIDQAEQDLLHTYNRYPIVLDHGDGMYLYDVNGKKYLDFVSGIGVFGLGYNPEGYNDALKAQIDKILHTSNYYYHEPAIKAAHLLKKVSGMDRVFFTNSGAEAIEGAIKAAQKAAYNKDGKNDHEIIAMEHSFHGRTIGALSVTGNAHYREAFATIDDKVHFATLNDFESVKSQVTDKTCAILLEVVQGEGGLTTATEVDLCSTCFNRLLTKTNWPTVSSHCTSDSSASCPRKCLRGTITSRSTLPPICLYSWNGKNWGTALSARKV